MSTTARSFIDSLGGYRAVAHALGKVATTVHVALSKGEFPASWFVALTSLAIEAEVEPPPLSLFSFIALDRAPPFSVVPAATGCRV